MLSLGLELLYFLEELKLISIESYKSENFNESKSIYVTHNELLNKLGDITNLFSISRNIPMLVKPKLYNRDEKTGKEILSLTGPLRGEVICLMI